MFQKEALDNVMRLCKDRRMTVINLQVVNKEEHFEAIITLRVKGRFDKAGLFGSINGIDGVLYVEWL